MNKKYFQGLFKPKNPQKYKGNKSLIIYRSSWEFKMMSFFDDHPSVLEWSSEEIAIPYISPLDGRTHRYFPDFYVKILSKDGTTTHYLLEIKPFKELSVPKKPQKITESYHDKVETFIKNQAKWQAATEYCKKKSWEFKILTEKEILLQ